jgi:RNA recognition motif-containing protein
MNIYVGNLSRQADESELRALFAQYGDVKSVKIMKDHASGEPRGFAFIDMPESLSANEAINQLDSKEMDGRRLRVNEAKPKTSTPQAFNSFSSNYGYKDRNSNF